MSFPFFLSLSLHRCEQKENKTYMETRVQFTHTNTQSKRKKFTKILMEYCGLTASKTSFYSKNLWKMITKRIQYYCDLFIYYKRLNTYTPTQLGYSIFNRRNMDDKRHNSNFEFNNFHVFKSI